MLSLKIEPQNGKRNRVVGINAGMEIPRTNLSFFPHQDVPVILHNVCHPRTDESPLQATR